MTGLKRFFKRTPLLLVWCALTIMAGTCALFGLSVAKAADIGANPKPEVDIAVSMPADYPGTFVDFKAEMTAKLAEQGLDPSKFRITSSAITIDTTNLDGWYVYDHYLNET